MIIQSGLLLFPKSPTTPCRDYYKVSSPFRDAVCRVNVKRGLLSPVVDSVSHKGSQNVVYNRWSVTRQLPCIMHCVGGERKKNESSEEAEGTLEKVRLHIPSLL